MLTNSSAFVHELSVGFIGPHSQMLYRRNFFEMVSCPAKLGLRLHYLSAEDEDDVEGLSKMSVLNTDGDLQKLNVCRARWMVAINAGCDPKRLCKEKPSATWQQP